MNAVYIFLCVSENFYRKIISLLMMRNDTVFIEHISFSFKILFEVIYESTLHWENKHVDWQNQQLPLCLQRNIVSPGQITAFIELNISLIVALTRNLFNRYNISLKTDNRQFCQSNCFFLSVLRMRLYFLGRNYYYYYCYCRLIWVATLSDWNMVYVWYGQSYWNNFTRLDKLSATSSFIYNDTLRRHVSSPQAVRDGRRKLEESSRDLQIPAV